MPANGPKAVFRVGTDRSDIFKVIASPEGSWVRVEADARAPWGSRCAADRVGLLNVNSVFVVQEWSCSPMP